MSFQLMAAGVAVFLLLMWAAYKIIKRLGEAESDIKHEKKKDGALTQLAQRTIAANVARARARRAARRARRVRNAERHHTRNKRTPR